MLTKTKKQSSRRAIFTKPSPCENKVTATKNKRRKKIKKQLQITNYKPTPINKILSCATKPSNLTPVQPKLQKRRYKRPQGNNMKTVTNHKPNQPTITVKHRGEILFFLTRNRHRRPTEKLQTKSKKWRLQKTQSAKNTKNKRNPHILPLRSRQISLDICTFRNNSTRYSM